MTLISVILPFRNAAPTIQAAIKSILQQRFDSFELILINDHSDDHSVEVIQSFNDERLKLVTNAGAGLTRALNSGIEQARGEYIARMDADDRAFPDRFTKQLALLKKRPANHAVSCQVKYVFKGAKDFDSTGYRHYVDWTNKIITPHEHYINRFVDAPIAHPTLFCRKAMFQQYGLYQDSPHPEDFELWLRWMQQGVKFEKVESVLYEWTDHTDRLSRTHEHYAPDKFEALKAKYLATSREIKQKKLWVVGYGKDVFKRTSYLVKYNLNIEGYVDIKARPQARRRVVGYNQVEKSKDLFYLVYVSDRTGKRHIEDYFSHQKMTPLEDYLFMT